jgi:hypothetical protein
MSDPGTTALPVEYRRGRTRAFTKEQIAAALRACGGNMTLAALRLSRGRPMPVQRSTVALYVRRYPELEDEILQGREELADLAEASLRNLVTEQHPLAVMYALNNLGRSRGYGQYHMRHEHSGPGGGPVQVLMGVVQVERMSEDDLDTYLQSRALPGRGGGGQG